MEQLIDKITDAIDENQFSVAINLSEKKEVAKVPRAIALKGFAHYRLGEISESIECSDYLIKNMKFDLGIYQIISLSYRPLHKFDELISLLKQLDDDAPDYHVLKEMCSLYLQNKDYLQFQLLAQKLYKLSNKPEYLFWSALGIYLQSGNNNIKLQLAIGMILKSNLHDTKDGTLFLIDLYKRSGKIDQIIPLLSLEDITYDPHRIPKFWKDCHQLISPLDKHDILLSYYLDKSMFEEAYHEVLILLDLEDNWNYYKKFVDLSVALHKSSQQLESEFSHMAERFNKSRYPLLCELYYYVVIKENAKIAQFIKLYIEKYGNKLSIFHDVKLFIDEHNINDIIFTVSIDFVTSCTTDKLKEIIEPDSFYKYIIQYVTYLQLLRYIDKPFPNNSNEINNVFAIYEQSAQILTDQKYFKINKLLLFIIYYFYDCASIHKERCFVYQLQSFYLYLKALSHYKNDYQIQLSFLELLNDLGCRQLYHQEYSSLKVSNFQFDTLFYLLTPSYISLYLVHEMTVILSDICKFYSRSEIEIYDRIQKALQHHNFCKVEEFMNLVNTFEFSKSWSYYNNIYKLFILSQPYATIKDITNISEKIVSNTMPFINNKDLDTSKLIDNRNYRVTFKYHNAKHPNIIKLYQHYEKLSSYVSVFGKYYSDLISTTNSFNLENNLDKIHEFFLQSTPINSSSSETLGIIDTILDTNWAFIIHIIELIGSAIKYCSRPSTELITSFEKVSKDIDEISSLCKQNLYTNDIINMDLYKSLSVILLTSVPLLSITLSAYNRKIKSNRAVYNATPSTMKSSKQCYNKIVGFLTLIETMETEIIGNIEQRYSIYKDKFKSEFIFDLNNVDDALHVIIIEQTQMIQKIGIVASEKLSLLKKSKL